MLYKKQLAKPTLIALIEDLYPDIYSICREQVFMAQLGGKPFPCITASLLPEDWDQLVDEYNVEKRYFEPDLDGIYEGKRVIWFTEATDENLPIPDDCLNIFIYSDQYKELK